MRKLFLTFFYSGLLPKAPGTWGSIAGGIVGFFIIKNLGVQTLLLATILLTIISIKEIDKQEHISQEHDQSWIVIDEVAGVWLAFCISGATNIQLILSLIFFRVFDILKPSIIGKIDRELKGGAGVMFDDLLAAVFAGIASGGVYQLAEYFSIV